MTFRTTDGLRPVTHILFSRKAIGDEIERLIGLLDAADADPDLEPAGDKLDASYPEGGCRMCVPCEDDEPTLGASCDHHGGASQAYWAEAADNAEREVENEHGGEIRDEPHDKDPDKEPWLGWCNPMAKGDGEAEGGSGCDNADYDYFPCRFDGKGHDLAAQLLRGAGRRCLLPDIIGERAIPLPNGGVMRVFVPASSGYVVRS